jgi:hypothetical protein
MRVRSEGKKRGEKRGRKERRNQKNKKMVSLQTLKWASTLFSVIIA